MVVLENLTDLIKAQANATPDPTLDQSIETMTIVLIVANMVIIWLNV